MIKHFQYFMLGIAAMALLSCNREIAPELIITPGEEPLEETGGKVPMVFSAALEEPETRSDISGNYILWESTDKIAVFDGTDINRFSASNVTSDGRGADFSGEAAVTDTYYAVAPFEAATNLSTANTRISITIPHSQVIVGDHCVDTKALVSTAVGTTSFSFQNQFSLMKVELEFANIVGISVVGNNNESIAGSNHFYYGGAGAPRVDLSNAGQKQVNLIYKETADGDASIFPTGTYYIPIWPTDFTKGYTVILTAADGGKSLKSTSSRQNLGRNGGQDLATIDDGTFCPPVIMTAAQLKMWRRLATVGAYAAGEEVKLGADIDLDGYVWKPVPEFLGIFDGQNHRIYNFTVSSEDERVGFIKTLGSSGGEEAVLKNVTFGSSDGTSADGSSSITANGASSRYVGLVAYAHKNSTIENVTNFIPVSIDPAVTRAKHYLGGIVSLINSNVHITGCVNKAAVTDNSAAQDAHGGSCIGGVVGTYGSENSFITACSNTGAINNTCKDVAYLGGIIGCCIGTNLTVENCTNGGKVTNSAASQQELNSGTPMTSKVGGEWQICLGGIVGCLGNASVIKCTNTAEIIQNACVEESDAYDELETETDTRPVIGGIVGLACRTGATIKGCTNNGRPRIESVQQYSAAIGGILGASSNSGKNCTVLVTRADDGTPTVNNADIDEKNSRGAQTQYSCYMGGIVGIGSSSKLTVSFCENNGNILTSQSQNQGTFRCGGICGMVYISTLEDCVNNGYIQVHGGGTSVTAQCGGICGGSYGDYPQKIARCTNNGVIGLYKVKNGSSCGGILSEWNPKQTDVTDCVSNGKITTGNMNSYPTDRNVQTVNDLEMGGLFGRVRSGNSAQAKVCTGNIVNCKMVARSGSMKYKGLIFGRHYDDKKVIIGSSDDPVMITSSAAVIYGTDANPSVNTVNSLTSLADSYPFIQGTGCRAYSATDGTLDTGKLELHLAFGTITQAGIN